MTDWFNGPFSGFDTETTGVDPHSDRIVTAAVVTRAGGVTTERNWLINPGIEIPAGASAIHGITTERARAEGQDPVIALEEIAGELTNALTQSIPVVAFNAGFDLTLLDQDLARHGLATLPERLGGPVRPVIDPLTLDRAVDRYRKGKRTLGHLCEVYQVEVSAALHDAQADVVATLDVLDALLRKHRATLGEMGLHELHDYQVSAHREWAENFRTWLESQGRTGGPSLAWPF